MFRLIELAMFCANESQRSAWLKDSRALKPRGFFWVGLNTAQDLPKQNLYARVGRRNAEISFTMRDKKPLAAYSIIHERLDAACVSRMLPWRIGVENR